MRALALRTSNKVDTDAVQTRCKACETFVNKQRQLYNPPVEKTCTTCRVRKPVADFWRNKTRSIDGYKVMLLLLMSNFTAAYVLQVVNMKVESGPLST